MHPMNCIRIKRNILDVRCADILDARCAVSFRVTAVGVHRRVLAVARTGSTTEPYLNATRKGIPE